MDAIVLAAGLGSLARTRSPRPAAAARSGWPSSLVLGLPKQVKRVVVVVNYLADQIDEYLRIAHIADWQTVRQEVPRGTGDALRCCRGRIDADRFLVLNGDDLYGAADLAELATRPAGLLVQEVNEPEKFGIVFARPDGTLDRLIEKPTLPPPQQANIGAYLFPRAALDVELPLSPRGEYEITDAVTAVAARGPFHVVPARFWLPIGTVEAWQAAQGADLSST